MELDKRFFGAEGGGHVFDLGLELGDFGVEGFELVLVGFKEGLFMGGSVLLKFEDLGLIILFETVLGLLCVVFKHSELVVFGLVLL